MKTRLACVVLAHLATVALANAQDKDPWIGKRVFTQDGTVLKVGNSVVDDEGRTASLTTSGRDRKIVRVYKVERTNGEWLWLKDEQSGIAGWARAKYVIPYEQAVDYYTNQIQADPSSSLYLKRGFAWAEKGGYDKAIADYNEALRLDPDSEAAYNNRGSSWNKKKEYDKAIADYNEAIRIDPKYATAYYNRGNARSNKREYDKAIADYDEAIRIDPKYALAYRGRGNAWSNKREYDKAIADYDEAIRIDPKFALAYVLRGFVLGTKKEYDKAIADLNEAVRLDPKDAEPYNGRAWLWATSPDPKIRDGKKAVESANRACELTDWKVANNLDTLAAAYAESGDFAKAVEWQEKTNRLLTDPELKKVGEARLKLYRSRKPYRDEG